jgi:prophage regulatory protein
MSQSQFPERKERLLRLPAVLDRVGDSRSGWYFKVRNGLAPAPVRIGTRAVAWPESTIDSYIAARISGQ